MGCENFFLEFGGVWNFLPHCWWDTKFFHWIFPTGKSFQYQFKTLPLTSTHLQPNFQNFRPSPLTIIHLFLYFTHLPLTATHCHLCPSILNYLNLPSTHLPKLQAPVGIDRVKYTTLKMYLLSWVALSLDQKLYCLILILIVRLKWTAAGFPSYPSLWR